MQSFNEELDKVFYEIELPEGEDWDAIAEDLRTTKMERRELERQNKYVYHCRLFSKCTVDDYPNDQVIATSAGRRANTKRCVRFLVHSSTFVALKLILVM